MHIPIVESGAFVAQPPQVAFLAAWNHEREILERNSAYAENGGRWVSHVPKIRFL